MCESRSKKIMLMMLMLIIAVPQETQSRGSWLQNLNFTHWCGISLVGIFAYMQMSSWYESKWRNQYIIQHRNYSNDIENDYIIGKFNRFKLHNITGFDDVTCNHLDIFSEQLDENSLRNKIDSMSKFHTNFVHYAWNEKIEKAADSFGSALRVYKDNTMKFKEMHKIFAPILEARNFCEKIEIDFVQEITQINLSRKDNSNVSAHSSPYSPESRYASLYSESANQQSNYIWLPLKEILGSKEKKQEYCNKLGDAIKQLGEKHAVVLQHNYQPMTAMNTRITGLLQDLGTIQQYIETHQN